MICNKILGKVTKFGGKRTKTLGVAKRFMVGGHNVPPPPPPLGFIWLNECVHMRVISWALLVSQCDQFSVSISSVRYTKYILS